MDELIEILNIDGSFSGNSIFKSEAHKKGIFHASVHIWILNHKNEVLLQKRTANKDVFPNLWDISVAGHISYGESPLTSGEREIEEEIGLKIQKEQLQFIQTFEKRVEHTNELIDHELHYIYVYKTNFDLNDLTLQKEEVAALDFIPLNSFLKKTMQHDFVPHGSDYFQLIFEALQKTASK